MLPALAPAAAGAETTHQFLKNVPLPVNGAQLMGVDPQGNVILFAEGAIRKFSANGDPVNFSALGTNVIDGAGSGNCPATPSDCDQTPWNSFGPASLADMNQATTGPTAGYMYAVALKEIEPGVMRSQVLAFDSTGVYRGQIDTSQATPLQDPGEPPTFLSVSPSGGIVVITYSNFGYRNSEHADKYQVVDADPAHDAFAGQIRKSDIFGIEGPSLNGGGMPLGAVADDEVTYVGRGTFVGPESMHPIWELYDASGFTGAKGDSAPVNLDPNGCECDTSGPWGLGGRHEDINGYFEAVSINPADHHAFLLDGSRGFIEEWATPTERVGFRFGSPETIGFAGGQMAFDTSGLSTNGRIYVSRGGSLAAFGPAVPLAGIEDLQASTGHTDATVTATINLDHGPKVASCRVEWGEEPSELPINYFFSKPCEPAAPYEDELTSISTEITGLQAEVHYRARVVISTNNGVNKSAPVKVQPHAVLDVRTDPATEITPTTAVLHGSLDPDNIDTSYWFEYGIDTNYRSRTAEVPAGSAPGDVAVTPTEITNLQPGRRYHFRLVAQNELGSTHGPDQSFVAAAPPAISGVQPTDVAETSATLNARIDPGGFATTYRFEYGTSTDYDHVVSGSVGDGTDPVPVKTDLSGLEPGATYHFRVVAENKWGSETTEDSTFNFFPQNCPNDYARQATRAAYLPDCRAYELVSPRNAGGVQLYPGELTQDFLFFKFLGNQNPHWRVQALNFGTATHPPRFSFLALAGAINGTNPPNSLVDTYTSTRTNTGWVTRYWGQKGNEVNIAGGAKCDLDMSTCIDYHLQEPLCCLTNDPNDVLSNAPYVWDAEGHSLGRWPTNLKVVKNGERYVGADLPSPDFSHYVFSSLNVPFTPDGKTGAPGSAYDNDIGNATVTKVSVLPGGDNIPKGGGGAEAEEFIKFPAVSTDGSHILMTTEEEGGVNLYMRVNDAITYPIAAGKKSIQLIGMTSDGSKVVFASRDKVTEDDEDLLFGSFPINNDIYVWEEQSNQVTRVSQGNGAGNMDVCEPPEGMGPFCSAVPLNARFGGTERPDSDDVMASESGDVYFYSPEQLDPDNPGVFNEKNLYVYRNGSVRYVATLDADSKIDRMQISPDGRHVAFLTSARLTSYDNQGWREMYTYNPETGGIRCVSCIPDGDPPTILRPAEDPTDPFGLRVSPSKDVMASASGRFMADDGRTVFGTSDALVESDTDGLVDVYEFVGGRPQLVTSGTAQSDLLVGNRFFPGEYTGVEAISRDGQDIFFSTFETLAPQEDINGPVLKFYDARTNGGFASPEAKLPCVAADECHGDENPGPAPAAIGTDANLGPVPHAKKRVKKRRRHRRKHRAHRRHRRHAHKGRHHG
jgi:hypothetical protein